MNKSENPVEFFRAEIHRKAIVLEKTRRTGREGMKSICSESHLYGGIFINHHSQSFDLFDIQLEMGEHLVVLDLSQHFRIHCYHFLQSFRHWYL